MESERARVGPGPGGFARGLAAGVLAALLVAASEFVRITPREPEDFEALAILLRRLLAIGLGAGLLFALVVALAEFLGRLPALAGRRREFLVALLLAAPATPLLVLFSRRLLAGQGIARTAGIELLRLAGPVVLGLLLLLVVRLALALRARLRSAPPLRAILVALGAFVGALAIQALDARLYVGLYPEAHATLAVASFALALAGSAILVGRAPRRRVLVAFLVAIALLAVLADRGVRAGAQTRYLLHARSLQGARVLELWRRLGLDDPEPEAAVLDGEFAAARRDAPARARALRAALELEFGARRPRHLLFITLDALRRDALGCYGASRPVSPNIDALAARSLVFERNWAQFPITSFSFQSTFHARYPAATPLFRRMTGRPDDPAGHATLATQLARAGFRTVSIPAISSASLAHPAYSVLGEGFAEVDPGGRPDRSLDAAEQVELARAVLADADEERLFLWLHLMDPHDPYRLHPSHDFGAGPRDRYDSEVAHADELLGRLLAELERRGLAGDTLVVLNSDHGEAFGEHGVFFHGTTLYEEQIAVPLLIHLPGGRSGRVASPTGNVDLVPTVLDLLGVEAATPMQGQSLAGFFLADLDPQLLPIPFAYAEIPDAIDEMAPANRDRRAIVRDGWKLIVNRRDDFVELYDLEADPGETFNLAARRPEIVARLEGAIRVLDQEAELVNVPEGLRSDEAWYAALAESLRAGPVTSRSRLIAENLRDRSARMTEILRERVADPKEHELIRLQIVDAAADRLDAAVVPALRELVRGARAMGSRARALDLWRRERLPLAGEDRSAAAFGLDLHPQIGWRAARLLAEHGDRRARIQLDQAFRLGDERTRFASACSLASLGDDSVRPVLVAGLVRHSCEPQLCAEAVRALARLGDREAFTRVLTLVRDRYAHHLVKLAALEYFEAVGGPLGLCAIAQLANGWDPSVGAAIRASAARIVGAGGVESLAAVGILRGEIFELARAGRTDLAIGRCAEAEARLEPLGAAPLFRMIRWRLLVEEGRADELPADPRTELPAETPSSWRDYARLLRDYDPEAPRRLELLALEPALPGPLPVGAEAPFLVRLRNAGAVVLPGGASRRSPNLGLIMSGRPPEGPALVARLPAPGLAPGEELELLLQVRVEEGDRVRVDLAAWCDDGRPVEVVDARAAETLVFVAGRDGEGLDPQDLAFDAAAVLERWAPSPAFDPGVIVPGPRAAYLARALDPILTGPLLRDCGRALELEIVFAACSTDPARRTDMELYWRFPGQDFFLPQQSERATIALDGALRTLRFRIEAQAGRSPRQLRLDFFQEPELVEIESVRIRAVD